VSLAAPRSPVQLDAHSSGVTALALSRDGTRLISGGKDGKLKLLNPGGKVQDLLILTRLQEIFEIYRDEREALTSF